MDLPDLYLSHLAYTDDVNLVSGTHIGLQLHLQKFRNLALQAGLETNIRKSNIFGLRACGGIRKVIPYRPSIKFDNEALDFVTFESPITYMGLTFNPAGLVPSDVKANLSNYLKNLGRLPAKPQQKLYILREVLLSFFNYCFSFYSFSIKTYNDFDVYIRKFVKQVLHLPHNFPNSFFYTSISDGGLCLLNAQWSDLLLGIINLFSRNVGGLSDFLLSHISKVTENIYGLLRVDSDRYLSTSSDISDFFRTSLYNTNDGHCWPCRCPK